MSDDEKVVLKGYVTELLPNAHFKVYVDEYDASVLAHLSGKMKKNNINVYTNDKVDIEVPVYDLTKGRITFRYKN